MCSHGIEEFPRETKVLSEPILRLRKGILRSYNLTVSMGAVCFIFQQAVVYQMFAEHGGERFSCFGSANDVVVEAGAHRV